MGGWGFWTRAGDIDRFGQLVVLALKRAVVVAPDLPGDLQGLFQALESFRGGGERHPETVVLAVVPGGADAEPGPTSRKNIEGGHRFWEEPRMAVGDASNQEVQVDLGGDPGEISESGVALQHRLGRSAQTGQLKEVIHDTEG